MRSVGVSALYVWLAASQLRLVSPQSAPPSKTPKKGSDALAYDASLYRRVSPVNTSECLDKVRDIPLRVYEFAYDSITGRRQLGVIGHELESMLPDSVEIKQQSFRNPDPKTQKTQPLVKLQNFPVVDKNVLFMHNVGATQALLEKERQLAAQAAALEEVEAEQAATLIALEERLKLEVEDQVKEKRELQEAEAEKAALEAALVEAKALEERSTLTKQAATERSTVDLEDQLAAERLEIEDGRERNRTKESLRLQEESARRLEEQRRESELLLKDKQLEQDRELEERRRVAELQRVAAEAKARAEAERANEDVTLRQIRAKGAEDRRRAMESIAAVMDQLGRGSVALLSNPRQLGTLILSIVALLAGGFIAREAATLARQVIEARLGRPRLVRETSRQRFNLFGNLFAKKLSPSDIIKHFEGVVLAAPLIERVQQLAVSTRNARRNRVPFRHLLLYGPPGTGKTMVAQRLARASGMDYALMSGGDVGPLGKDAVTELHALFRWAKGSSKGLLLFIDEAEAFLGSRSKTAMSEELRNALNALLYQTGTQSYNFMMVLATNRAEDLDSAVIDRMDESLLFPLPTLDLRGRLTKIYFDAYVTNHTDEARTKELMKVNAVLRLLKKLFVSVSAPIKISAASAKAIPKHLEQVADLVEGFSGREISKLMIAVQSAAYGSEANELKPAMLLAVTKLKVEEHRRKVDMVMGLHMSPRVRKADAASTAGSPAKGNKSKSSAR